jgi:hypothetical protein
MRLLLGNGSVKLFRRNEYTRNNKRSIVPRVCFCGNVFSDPLPSNTYCADHIENNYFLLLSANISDVA